MEIDEDAERWSEGSGLEQEGQKQEERGSRGLNPHLLVKRDRLLLELSTKGREAGISIVCAPKGFGKTALLLAYTSQVKGEVERGAARMIPAQGKDAEALVKELEKCMDELPLVQRPLVAIDDMSSFEDAETARVVAFLRTMREKGYEVIISCGPENRLLTTALSDSFKVGAQALIVRPREYAAWTRTFAISQTLDVYALTQGVPSLVALLRSATGTHSGLGTLERGAAALYKDILETLRLAHDPLYRVCCMLLLLGKGTLADVDRCGVRMKAELVSRLARDYPVFGLDAEKRSFSCMAVGSTALMRLRRDIAGHRSGFVPKATRALLQMNRVDDAVELAERLLDTKGMLEVVAGHATRFALSGNAVFVHQAVARLNGEDVARAPVSVLLAVYLSALTMGEYRLARSMCSGLCQRAHEIEQELSAADWMTARALGELWDGCAGATLPQLSSVYEQPPLAGEACLLRMHRTFYRAIFAGGEGPLSSTVPLLEEGRTENEVDVARVLITCDQLLDNALHGTVDDPEGQDSWFQTTAEQLSARRLTPLAARVRMVAATCRIMTGLPVVDERAFIDASTVAVRESDLPTQLFCTVGEGWKELATGQVASARFRAQQALKLSDDGWGLIRSWAKLLECAAYITSTPRVTMYEEAELLDLAQEQVTPADAWVVALRLAAARFDAELAAWYSLHKEVLLDVRFCPLARLALHYAGERATSIRRLMPSRVARRYLLGSDGTERAASVEVAPAPSLAALGQVSIGLFGGFSVERNGHMVTNEVWRRKRASTLAARLALAPGSFVGRRTITEEMWPETPYVRARENLYACLSALRAAFGQQADGPQYVLTQGDGLSLNNEFVVSDTSRFDMLSRNILLKRSDTESRQIVEACLKVEQIYKGPLYVPDVGDTTYFLHYRRAYLNKFVDCMLRGVDVALEIDDLPSASWLIEAALRTAPLREDVVRRAMRVYDLSGRKREVVELYNSHQHYLEHELQAMPDDNTRRAYEEIMERSKLSAMM